MIVRYDVAVGGSHCYRNQGFKEARVSECTENLICDEVGPINGFKVENL